MPEVAPKAEDEIQVTLTRQLWHRVLENEPFQKETYTEDGIETFDAYQAIHVAVDAPPG